MNIENNSAQTTPVISEKIYSLQLKKPLKIRDILLLGFGILHRSVVYQSYCSANKTQQQYGTAESSEDTRTHTYLLLRNVKIPSLNGRSLGAREPAAFQASEHNGCSTLDYEK